MRHRKHARRAGKKKNTSRKMLKLKARQRRVGELLRKQRKQQKQNMDVLQRIKQWRDREIFSWA